MSAAGTFLPVSAEDTQGHRMHAEWASLSADAAARLVRAKRIAAVGTTSLRTLESAARRGALGAFEGETDIFITPGYRFRTADILLTNFHLPRSTLFMLVSAFSGLGHHEGRLCGGDQGTLSLLFLWRRVPAIALPMLRIDKTDGAARTGTFAMPRGEIRTPAFMPLGTAGSVKAMMPQSVRETGADIILGNTYHLMLRPGAERVARLGGLHKFMNWERPILTDSGGFQVMSLAKLRKLDEDGVRFRSHIDGSEFFLTPERAMEIQRLLGSDIQMVLDECPAYPATRADIEKSLALTMRWAKRSKTAFGEQPGHACFRHRAGRASSPICARAPRPR